MLCMSTLPNTTSNWLSDCPVGANIALVGLGANLPAGQSGPAETLRQAVAEMRPLSLLNPLVSPFLVTEPEDCPPGSPVFMNAVALLCCSIDIKPSGLLASLLEIESRLGRKRTGLRNEPRVLDLDLLAFADECCHSEFLTLPHPRAHQRRFVLEPLSVIWPDYQFPGQTQSVKTLLESL